MYPQTKVQRMQRAALLVVAAALLLLATSVRFAEAQPSSPTCNAGNSCMYLSVITKSAVSPVSPVPVPRPQPPSEPGPPLASTDLVSLTWTSTVSSPLALFEGQGTAVNSALYLFGGFSAPLTATVASWSFEPASGTWTRIADMPEPLTHGGHANDGPIIYMAGGFLGDHPGGSVQSVWAYDTRTDTWSAMPSLPEARGGGALVRLGRRLHFFGGTTRRPGGVYEADHGDHWDLDLDNPTAGWTRAATMPNPRNHMAGAALFGKIYAIGGQYLGDEADANQTSVNVYDPVTDQWTDAAPLPLPLGHITTSTFAAGGRIFVIGGVTQGAREADDVLVYDPETNAWSNLTPLPAQRQSPIAGVIDGKLVVTTGERRGQVFTNTWIGDWPTSR
jgi:N-acetylneuraminic acid mutarotase